MIIIILAEYFVLSQKVLTLFYVFFRGDKQLILGTLNDTSIKKNSKSNNNYNIIDCHSKETNQLIKKKLFFVITNIVTKSNKFS